MSQWWPAQILIISYQLTCSSWYVSLPRGPPVKIPSTKNVLTLWHQLSYEQNLYFVAHKSPHKSKPCFTQNPQQHNVTNALVVDHVDLPRAPGVLNSLANTLRIIKDQLSWWWSSCWCWLDISRFLLYQAPPTSPGQPGDSIIILQFFNFPHLWSCVDVDWRLSKTIECDWVGPSFHSVPPGGTLYCIWKTLLRLKTNTDKTTKLGTLLHRPVLQRQRKSLSIIQSVPPGRTLCCMWKGLQILWQILRQDQIKDNEIGKDSTQAPPSSETGAKTKTNMKPEFSLQ